jgi:acyl carrier protein
MMVILHARKGGFMKVGRLVSASRGELIQALREIVTKHSRIKPAEVSEDAVLARDLGYDSLALLMAITDIENHFGFTFPVEQVEDLHAFSFRDLIRILTDEKSRAISES